MTRVLALACAAATFAVPVAPAAPAFADECYGLRVAGVCATSWCLEAACSVTLPGVYAFCEHPLPVGWCALVSVPPEV